MSTSLSISTSNCILSFAGDTATLLCEESVLLVFLGDELILHADGRLPAWSTLQSLSGALQTMQIGELGGMPCITCQWPAVSALPDGLHALSLRTVYSLLPPPLYKLATRAKLLHSWQQQHRFCGACGTATEALTHEPARRCPACGSLAYPRLSPAIMVLIHRGDELLLARSPHFKPGVYSALAGFVDAGEDVEDCVHREVAEEVGLQVGNLRWFGSQSWPFPHSLMLAFHADYVAGEIQPQAEEIEDAQWFRKDALPDLPNPVSIAHRLIMSALSS